MICQVIIDKENNRKCLAEQANSGNTSGRNGHLKTHNKSQVKKLKTKIIHSQQLNSQ